MMVPARHKTLGAQRYKGLVKAGVPAKRSDFLEHHIDSHYLFARVAYQREFAIHFKDDCMIMSCDDMNKVNVVTLAVTATTSLRSYSPPSTLHPKVVYEIAFFAGIIGLLFD